MENWRGRWCSLEPVRVLHVFAGLDRGGAESMIMNIYRSIDRERLQFDFAAKESGSEYAFEDEIKVLGGRVYRVPELTGLNILSYARTWDRLLKAHPEWGIVHAHDPATALIILGIAKMRLRVTVAHSHTCGGATPLRLAAKTAMCYPLRYIADHLFACSGMAARWMFGSGAKRARIVKNAIELNRFAYNPETRSRKRSELGVRDRFVVGHVGRFSGEKNHARLVDVFELVHSRHGDAVLLLVGDGVLRDRIAGQVSVMGLSGSVIFAGERSDVPDLLQAMDVFVLPSLYEGLGVAVVEAQAAGLRCVVADAVPEEARLTDLVDVVPLAEPDHVWAAEIMKWTGGYDRSINLELIATQGYDVGQSARLLEQFYLQEAGDRDVR